MFKKIKDYFTLQFEKEYINLFLNENLLINLHRAKLVIIMTSLIEVGVIISFLVYHQSVPFTDKSTYYLVFYFAFIVISAIFYLIVHILNKKKSVSTFASILTYCYVFFMIGWNMGITLLDGNITSYILALMAVSLIGVLRPLGTIGTLALLHVTFFLLAPTYFDKSDLFAIYTNSTIGVLVSAVVSIMLFKTRVNSFKSRIEAEKKSIELKKINKELNIANKKLEYISKTDGLTGIYNRRMFDENSFSFWLDCKKEDKQLAVIMIDIDHFKIYNDTYGHQLGDDCLKTIVKTIKSILPDDEDSLLARYGGEEFVILLKGADKDIALAMCERIREIITAMNIEHKNSPVKKYVTLSLGVFSGIPSVDGDVLDFVSHADGALYEAKKTGRDKVITAE